MHLIKRAGWRACFFSPVLRRRQQANRTLSRIPSRAIKCILRTHVLHPSTRAAKLLRICNASNKSFHLVSHATQSLLDGRLPPFSIFCVTSSSESRYTGYRWLFMSALLARLFPSYPVYGLPISYHPKLGVPSLSTRGEALVAANDVAVHIVITM